MSAMLALFTIVASAGDGHASRGDLPLRFDQMVEVEASCDAGRAQSPIDLPRDAHQAAGLTFRYGPTPLQLHHAGHAVRLDVAPGNWLQAHALRFELVQVHAHVPAEHRLDGHTAPAELHLVHRAQSGALAVVGIFLMPGPDHSGLHALADQLGGLQVGDRHAAYGTLLDLATWLPEVRSYHTYGGSLTTPPCTEGVRWFVLTDPVTVGPETLRALVAGFAGTSRPVQARSGRVIAGGSP